LRSASNFWLSCGTVGLAAIVAMAMEQQHPGWQLLLHVADATLQLLLQYCRCRWPMMMGYNNNNHAVLATM